MSTHPTRDEAIDRAIRDGLELDTTNEGFTVTSCTCGRTDLHDMDEARMSAIMANCPHCERQTFPPAGHA